MGTGDKRDPIERGSTDESLRLERHKTDHALAKNADTLGHAAASVLGDAREKADTVLDDARAREDLKTSNDVDHTLQDRRDLSRARAHEDAILSEARQSADVLARNERGQQQIALARLLAFERQDTDLKLELERMRADTLLTSREDFMAIVSHDLRSLLGGIALSAQCMKGVEHSPEPFERVKLYADRIQRFSARMNRLIGDLMDVASIEAGKLALVRSRRDGALLLRDALDAFEEAATQDGIQLSTTCIHEPGVLEVDHDRILQVLTNLVGNALKFTPRGGKIGIAVETREGVVTFSVRDTGEGIERELLGKIFDRYFQSHDIDRRGLGLGLFIAKSIVEGHGGTIWAESEPGLGSAFYFTVPSPP
ncbi:MAG: HAMP domain-containing histidine kinase [Deltaproteobacteria bacterium]|nr:HAMP domain-containing histidine kinase [Deltaproteobacteria bacterium]